MATKSFLKNIVIKDKKVAGNFIDALNNAKNKKAKKVVVDKRIENIMDKEHIRKIFID